MSSSEFQASSRNRSFLVSFACCHQFSIPVVMNSTFVMLAM
jgi:hypothetical protein